MSAWVSSGHFLRKRRSDGDINPQFLEPHRLRSRAPTSTRSARSLEWSRTLPNFLMSSELAGCDTYATVEKEEMQSPWLPHQRLKEYWRTQRKTDLFCSIRGRILTGTVVSTKMHRTLVIRREYLHFVPKYSRYEKRHSNLAAHVSPAFRVQEGDQVTVGQCRPLSKTVR